MYESVLVIEDHISHLRDTQRDVLPYSFSYMQISSLLGRNVQENFSYIENHFSLVILDFQHDFSDHIHFITKLGRAIPSLPIILLVPGLIWTRCIRCWIGVILIFWLSLLRNGV